MSVQSSRLNLISVQGELAHRALKAFYPLTSKLDTPAQLAKHERRRRVLRRVAEAGHAGSLHTSLDQAPAGFKGHHYIAQLSRNNPLHIFSFLRGHGHDPAVDVSVALLIVERAHNDAQKFIPKLKDHLLYRLRGLDVGYCDHTFTDDERNSVIIIDNKMYSVQTMQVRYTKDKFYHVIFRHCRFITQLTTFAENMTPLILEHILIL